MQQSVQLHKSIVDFLQRNKNLLAFSAGIDSSALFFILKENDIDFDMAIVDYNTRNQSKQEIEYAQNLADKYDKKLFIHSCSLKSSNFEHNARIQRYNFFEKIISGYKYDNLLTAHQLNDKMEWFLMQLSRGSGLVELLGMEEIELGIKYNKVKPLLHISKQELLNYLLLNKIEYFIDESNKSKKYFRNRIRDKYANSFIDEFAEGLKNSFYYLQNDKDILLPKNEIRIEDLFVLKRDNEDLKNIRQIDKAVKKLGISMSKAQRDEILRTKNCVISDKIAVVFTKKSIFISPFKKTHMQKKFKEFCRVNKIPTKIRPYLHDNIMDTTYFLSLLHHRL